MLPLLIKRLKSPWILSLPHKTVEPKCKPYINPIRAMVCSSVRLFTTSSESKPLVILHVESESGVAVVTLNRPEARNALNMSLANELCETFQSLAEKPNITAVVLTGNGSAFCAGADLKERNGMTDEQWEAQHQCFQKAALSFRDLPMPTIAAVNGPAFGGGLELVCLADWAFSAQEAKFGFPEVHLGIFPGMGATVTLPRLIHPSLARRLILTGQTFTALEGYRAGLFVQLVNNDESVVDVAMKDAQRISLNGPLAVRCAKKSIRECGEMLQFRQAWDHSLDLYATCFRSKERLEGIQAYNEKRRPNF